MIDFNNVKEITIPEGVVLKIMSGSKILWEKITMVNQVPISIDTDGSIYNGTGYIEGYRLSSSGGLSAQANTVTTGFIPYVGGDVVRMAGVDWQPGTGGYRYCYIAFYDSAFTLLGSYNIYSSNGANTARGIVNKSTTTVTTDSNGITTFNMGFTNTSNIAYCRINGYGSGADMIVTVNQEITV